MNHAQVELAPIPIPAPSSAPGQFVEIAPITAATVRIGNITLQLNAPSDENISLNRALSAFSANSLSSDISLDVRWNPNLRRLENPDFNSHAVWTFLRREVDFVFDFTRPPLGLDPYKRLRIDQDFSAGEILLNSQALQPHTPICPLEYPADELLITNYLAHRRLGVEVHGCGLIDGQTGGYLFLGHSGAGKSTTARFWQSLRGPEILSDDRIILRLHDNELWMYGTPWHGEAAFASPGKARLNRVFILQHGPENKIVTLPKARAVGELFARCFPPFHSASGLNRTIEFLNRVVETVPCYQFCFVPEISAVQAALAFHD